MKRGKYAPKKNTVVCSAAWSQGISKRLKELGMSKTELAARCEVSGGSITGWLYGNNLGQPVEPSAENLIRLANALDTTSDYLLGLTTSPTRNNPDLRNACDYTGLSEGAVKALQDMKVWNLGKWNLSMLNLMLENKSFSELLSRVADFAKANTSKEYSPGNGITYAEPELARMAVQTYMNGILNDLRVHCEGVIDSRDYFMMILLMKQTKRISPAVFDEAMKITNLIFDDIGYPYEQLVKEGISDEAFLSELKKISELKC